MNAVRIDERCNFHVVVHDERNAMASTERNQCGTLLKMQFPRALLAAVLHGARAAFNRFPEMESNTRPAFYHPGNALESSLLVVIADQLDPALLRAAMAHEMGHSFGLQHVPAKSALMHENLYNEVTKCVTELDLREAHRYVAFDADYPCDSASE